MIRESDIFIYSEVSYEYHYYELCFWFSFRVRVFEYKNGHSSQTAQIFAKVSSEKQVVE